MGDFGNQNFLPKLAAVPSPPTAANRLGVSPNAARRQQTQSAAMWRALILEHADVRGAFCAAIRESEPLARALVDACLSHEVLARPQPSLPVAASLQAHAPRCVQRRLAESGSAERYSEEFDAALLFADVSGFTRLATQLGVEELKRHINAFFSQLLAIVTECGGDVVKFAGDAVLLLWRVGDGECSSLPQAVASAAVCALQLESRVGHYEAGEVTLRLHCGLGCGPTQGFHLSSQGRSEYVIDGAVMGQIAKAEGEAQTGQTVASAEAWAQLRDGDILEATPTEGGNFLLVRALGEPSVVVPEPVDASGLDLSPYAHPQAVQAAQAGSLQLLSELREVAVLFVNVQAPPAASLGERGEQLQAIMEAGNGSLEELGGQLRQLIVDDKGTVLIGSFGLVKHKNDCSLALTAARAIVERLQAHDIAAFVGVTLGAVYCGLVGSAERCEYAMMGPSVNLSARLMASSANTGVLCDHLVQQRCLAEGSWTFEALDPIVAKGYAEPVRVYAPLQQQHQAVEAVVGRDAELDAIEPYLQAVQGAVCVRGEGGAGKSTLVAEVVRRAHGRGLRVRRAAASEQQQAVTGSLWRGLGREITAEGSPELLAVLGVSPSADHDPNVDLGTRMQRRADALVALLTQDFALEPTVLVLEDMQWADAVSWRVLDRVLASKPRVFVLLATRPLESYPKAYINLNALVLELGALSTEACADLAKRLLGTDELEEGFAEQLRERSRGNLMFAVAMLHHLSRTGDWSHVPTSINDAIVAQVDRLSGAAQAVLKAASCVGMAWSEALVQLLRPCEEDEIANAVAELEAAGGLVDRAPGVGTFAFHHALVHESVGRLLLEEQRSRMHLALAEHLATEGSASAAVLAAHWEIAGRRREAAAAWLEAASEAGANSVNGEAAVHAQRGLDLCLEADDAENGELVTALCCEYVGAALTLRFTQEAYQYNLDVCDRGIRNGRRGGAEENRYFRLLALRNFFGDSTERREFWASEAAATENPVHIARSLVADVFPHAAKQLDVEAIVEAAEKLAALDHLQLHPQLARVYGSSWDLNGLAAGGAMLLMRGDVEGGTRLLRLSANCFTCAHTDRTKPTAAMHGTAAMWALSCGAAALADELFAEIYTWLVAFPAASIADATQMVRGIAMVFGGDQFGELASLVKMAGFVDDEIALLIGYYRGEPECWKLVYREDYAQALALADFALEKEFTVASGEAHLEAVRAVALAGLGREVEAVGAAAVATSEFERHGFVVPIARVQVELERHGLGTLREDLEQYRGLVERPAGRGASDLFPLQ